MRVFFMGNNWVGLQCLKWLQEQGYPVVGMAVHPPERSKFRQELLQVVQGIPIFDGAQLRDDAILAQIAALQADVALSIFFGYILKEPFIRLFPSGVINLHPSLLPYNRGTYPNVWSIVEQTPAGATLHYIDTGIDSGDLIAQQKVEVAATDTGETLYRKLEQICVQLFQETWPLVAVGQAPRFAQPVGGTTHRARDVANIDEIHLDQTYVARDLINVLRARTFGEYAGAYFIENGRKIYLQLQLVEEL